MNVAKTPFRATDDSLLRLGVRRLMRRTPAHCQKGNPVSVRIERKVRR
jgi:hypothetical protein